jgi:hypothetical protein
MPSSKVPFCTAASIAASIRISNSPNTASCCFVVRERRRFRKRWIVGNLLSVIEPFRGS